MSVSRRMHISINIWLLPIFLARIQVPSMLSLQAGLGAGGNALAELGERVTPMMVLFFVCHSFRLRVASDIACAADSE